MEHDDACLKCTICNQACPVSRVDPDFPGPKALGPEWWRRRLGGDESTLAHVDDCTFCQLCEASCPASVPVAHLIQMHKAERPPAALHQVRDAILTRLDLIERFPQVATWKTPLDGLLGLSHLSERPHIDRPRPPRHAGDGGRRPVGVFVDCFARVFDGGVIDAAEALLRDWGWEPWRVPEKAACCGAAAHASGRLTQARAAAQDMREGILAVLGEHPDITTIVTLNGTCDQTVAREWTDTYEVGTVDAHIVPFTEFAQDEAPESFWEELRQVAPGERIYTHTTCRARVGRGDGILDQICRRAGLSPVWTGLTCCGASGSYAFKAEHDLVAHRMVDALGSLSGDGALGLMTDSGTCALHLAQETGLHASHPATFLYELWCRAGHRAEEGA